MPKFKKLYTSPEQLDQAMANEIDQSSGLQNLSLDNLKNQFSGGTEIPQEPTMNVQKPLLPREAILHNAPRPNDFGGAARVLNSITNKDQARQMAELQEAEAGAEFDGPDSPAAQRAAMLRKLLGK